MRLEIRRIEGEVSGPRSRRGLKGIAVAAIHHKKAILWRIMAPSNDEIERVTKVVSNCNKMIEQLAKDYPELAQEKKQVELPKPPPPAKPPKPSKSSQRQADKLLKQAAALNPELANITHGKKGNTDT